MITWTLIWRIKHNRVLFHVLGRMLWRRITEFYLREMAR